MADKSLEELISLLKSAADDVNHSGHVLTTDEINQIRLMIEEYNSSEELRITLKEMVKHFNENGFERETLSEMVKTYTNIKGFIRVMIAIRNIIIIITPIIGVWAIFKGWITLGIGG